VAEKGTLNITLSGSGTISPVNRKEIVVVVDGVVTENYLEEGKSFKKEMFL
jgi:multidrug efflux pump subunit AcrA (membrane-fusion protein)